MPYLLALLCGLIAITMGNEVRAEKRIALVIGNATYQNTAPLVNPMNDAPDIAAALTRLGFEVVDGRDLDKRAMERSIRQFGIKLAGADLALFFYAGHGVQVGGQNYLVPTDARLAAEGDVDFETVPLNLVLKQMEREAKTSVILLDACRDNPLAQNLARAMSSRAVQVGQGLAEVKTGVGTLIGFSTQPGNIALDGSGRNSPYAEAILKHMEAPGKDLSTLLIAVRNDVLQSTNGRQVPWEHTSLTGQVYLNRSATGVKEASSGGTGYAPSYDKDMELAFWGAVKDSKSTPLLQTYIDRFPAGTFAGLARAMIEEQKKSSSKVASLPTASLPTVTTTEGTQDPLALSRTLQTELRRVGCDPGSVDGKWGNKAKDALKKFSRLTKTTLSTEEPTDTALRALAAHKDRVCPLDCDRGETEVDGKCVAKAKSERKRQYVQERPARRRERAEREERPAKSGGLCWQQDGRGFSVGSCSK